MPDAAWRELLFRGWPIAEIRREAGGLEDLYLSLTERKAA
jgi:ABC-2 type transport system ATP-binding protein